MGEDLVHVPDIPPFPATHSILPIMEHVDVGCDEFIKGLFVCVGLVGRNNSEPDCFYNLYKL
jgi:hypothetical protein